MGDTRLSPGREPAPAFSPFTPATTPAAAGFYTLDLRTGLVECDDQTYLLHGLDPSAPPRMESFLARVPIDDLPALTKALADLSTACGEYRVEYRIAVEGGGLRSMEACGRVLAGPDGAPSRMIGVVTDTSVHRAQHDVVREFAVRLQRHMMPGALAAVPGVELAARYLPATDGLLIGGDWYDLVPRPDGTAVLVIGDVQGHGVEAACFMGQLRAGLRAYLAEGHELARTMAMTNAMLHGEHRLGEEGLFASCCLAGLAPGGQRVEVCCAGHLPPVVAVPGYAPWFAEAPAGLLLGVAADSAYETATAPLPPGSTLLMCTDGLLESGPGDLDAGLARVLPVLTAGHGTALGQLADELVAAARPGAERFDDIAVLLARMAV